MSRASPWWDPTVHADRRPALLARGRITAALRRWFEARGFTEVETACLQVSPGNEAHLHAFATDEVTDAGARTRFHLHTSPEFAAKKLVAAGEDRLFTFARVFRNRERSALHHPEFTMLEWYRAREPYEVLMEDCAKLIVAACDAAGTDRLVRGEIVVDPRLPPERVSLAEAFERFVGIDLLALVDDRDRFAEAVTARGLRVASDDGWSDIFSRALVEWIEPRLGRERITFLDRYPVSEAALARPAPDDPRVAERFEVYACGVELANAFGELTDPVEQRRRFVAEMDEKERVHGERYPIDEDFLEALATMPPTSGIALGFDRVVMLATGAPKITDVLWTPVARPGTGDR